MFGNSCSPGVDFTNILLEAFTHADPKSAKNTVKLSVSFCAFGICPCKSCSKNVDEIDNKFQANIWFFLTTELIQYTLVIN